MSDFKNLKISEYSCFFLTTLSDLPLKDYYNRGFPYEHICTHTHSLTARSVEGMSVCVCKDRWLRKRKGLVAAGHSVPFPCFSP